MRSVIRSLSLLPVAALLVALVAAMPNAPAPESFGPATTTVGVWTVHTTSLDFNDKTGDFSVPNRLMMTREGGDVEADRANGNFKSQVVTLYGDVTMHDLRGDFAGMAGASVTKPNGPATLTADQVRIDGKARVYNATGHVHYVQARTVVDADRAMLNDASHMLYLSGHARVSQGPSNVVADRIAYNTVTGDAHAEGKDVIMQFPSGAQPHIATPKPIHIPGLRTPHPG